MEKYNIVRIDKIKWWITTDSKGFRLPVPLCPIHNLKMYPVEKDGYGIYRETFSELTRNLGCAEGHIMELPREYKSEKRYVLDRIDSKLFKSMKVLNLDDEALPIAESKISSSNNKYFVTSRLMDSKCGKQLVIYAGEKGKSEKTQIFVEPETKRMDFDRNNLHPDEVFVEVTAKFIDGSTHTIKKEKRK